MGSSPGDMVGRVAETARLRGLVEDLAAGVGAAVWLDGEPGIGKSTLVDALVGWASAAGCGVRRGAGQELMEAFPLRLIADCLGVSERATDPAAATIASLLSGETAGLGAVDPVLAAGERILALVDQWCADKPQLLVLEDLHWADEPSLLLWNRLAHAVRQIPLLLVATARPAPSRDTIARVRDLTAQRGGLVLDLGPLGVTEVAQLAAGVLGAAPDADLSAELARAGGNPLYVRELVEAMRDEHVVEVAGGTARLHGTLTGTPRSLSTVIERRLGLLSPRTQQVLRAAAVQGCEVDAHRLELILGDPVARLAGAVEEALKAGVLVDTGEHVAFRHELIRQVLVEQVPAALRTGMHRDIARVLADAGAGVDQVAQHLLAVPGRLDGWALEWLAGTADAMLQGAPEVSVQLLQRAVGDVPEHDPRWELFAVRLARVLFMTGQDAAADAIAGRIVARTTDAAVAADMRILTIRTAGRTHRFDAALAMAEPALADPTLPDVWRARLGAWLAVILTNLGRLDDAREQARTTLELALRCGDPLAAGYARHTLAYLSEPAAQLGYIEDALAGLGDDAESMDLRFMLMTNRLDRLSVSGQRHDLDTALTEALMLADRAGTIRAAQILANAAGIYLRSGRWDEALVYASRAHQDYPENPSLTYLHGLVALVALHRDDRELADRHLAAAVRGTPTGPAGSGTPALYLATARAMRAELGGDLPGAIRLQATWLDLPAGPFRDIRCDEAPYLVRLALAGGDRATAGAAAVALPAGPDGPVDRVLAARLSRAMLTDDAAELLAVAAAYRGHGWPQHEGFAMEEAAVRLAEAGDVEQARATLTGAVRAYTGLGATYDIRRADARLRANGVRRGPRSVRRRPATGWAALTPAEERITHLVARGLSNPDIAIELFLSRNTVQTHVSNILAKLQLRSRIDIVREVAKQAVGQAGRAGQP